MGHDREGQGVLNRGAGGQAKEEPPLGVRCLNQVTTAVSVVPMKLKMRLSCVPTIVTAVMMTTAISAAMRPYSIAVTPSSSRMNFSAKRTSCMMSLPCVGYPVRICGPYLTIRASRIDALRDD